MPGNSRTTRREFLRDSALIGAAVATVGLGQQRVVAREVITREGPPRLKVSCAAYSYRRFLSGPGNSMDLDGFVDACAAAGLDGVESTAYYFPSPVTGEYLRHIKRKCYLLGLDISGTAVGSKLCLPPGEARESAVANAKAWLDHAAAMGAPYCRVFAGGVPEGATYDQALQWCVECLEQVSEYGATRGVMVGLENHGGITSTPEQTLRIVERVQSDWFGLNLDVANFHGDDPYADAAKVARYAISVHLKTEVRPTSRPKQPMDFRRLIEMLRSVNYSGYLTIEHEADEDPREAVPRYAQMLKALLR